MNVEKKIKNILRKKVLVCSKDLKGAPLNTLKLFSAKCLKKIFSTFIKNAFDTNSIFFSQKYAGNKIKRNFDRKVFKLQRFSKVFPYVGGNALVLRGHQSKNLLKP